jgi:hypothetical protein
MTWHNNLKKKSTWKSCLPNTSYSFIYLNPLPFLFLHSTASLTPLPHASRLRLPHASPSRLTPPPPSSLTPPSRLSLTPHASRLRLPHASPSRLSLTPHASASLTPLPHASHLRLPHASASVSLTSPHVTPPSASAHASPPGISNLQHYSLTPFSTTLHLVRIGSLSKVTALSLSLSSVSPLFSLLKITALFTDLGFLILAF